MSGIWSPGTSVNADGLVFGTDATGTTNDQRTRVVAAAVVACTLKEGQATEVGRITQVLPPGTSVVQGEALALALLLRHTTGQAEVTADCRPAILQAGRQLSIVIDKSLFFPKIILGKFCEIFRHAF